MKRIEPLMHYVILLVLVFGSLPFVTCSSPKSVSWRDALPDQVRLLGHRNWIIIADSAYPLQSAPGILTMATGESQIDVLKTVLQAVAQAPHVRANVLLDTELKYVAESEAPGVEAYRKELKALLNDKNVKTQLHEETIAKLDEASRLFNVVIYKTTMTIPYTSVFLELDCGYWNSEQEQRMREEMVKSK